MLSPLFASPVSPRLDGATALIGVLLLAVSVAAVLAWSYRQSALKWQARSQHWFEVAMHVKPMVSETGAMKLMRDLFPRPMGVPSAERDVESQREWRERRAVTSRDHLTRHSVDATNDSEAATEILMFTVGGGEVERE